MKITAHGDSHIGRVRQTNEDHYLHEQIRDDEELFIVADGMGGHQAGDVASRLGACSFAASYKRLRKQEKSIVSAMSQALRKANSVILRKAQLDPRKKGMGTTFSGAVVSGDTLNVIHVGDSRIYLIRNGLMRRLTTDQTFVAKMVEDGRITEEEARDHPQKNILYMSLGARDQFTPEIISDVQLEEGDILVLCSDGLNTHIPDDVIRAYAESYYPREAVAGLIRLANESGGVDNITVQVIRLGPIGDLDNTVALQRPPQVQRFPYVWALLAALLLVIFAAFFWFADKGSPASQSLQKLPGNMASTAKLDGLVTLGLGLEPVDVPAQAAVLLRSDPRHLVHFAAGRIWLFAGDRYLLVKLDGRSEPEQIVLPKGDRLIPNPQNELLRLRRAKSRRVLYSIHGGADDMPLMRLQADDAMDGVDQLSRTVSISGLKPPVIPVFINKNLFVFTDSSNFVLINNPLMAAEPLHLRKCLFGEGLSPLLYSIKLADPGLVMLVFVKKDRQLRICRISAAGEPTIRVIPFVFFRQPLGVEYLAEDRIMAYFPDGATLLDADGNNRKIDLIAGNQGLRLARVVPEPWAANRLAVTSEGGLYRVTIK